MLEPDASRWMDMKNDGAHYAFVPTTKYSGNGKARQLSTLLFSLLLAPYCLLRALFSGKPDAIIYSSPHPYGYPGAWMAAKLLGAKILFEVRDIWPLSLIELAGMSPTSPVVAVTAWVEKFAYKKSDKVVSLLPCAKEHMVKHGMSPDKFVWVPNGVGDADIAASNLPRTTPAGNRVIELRREGYFVLVYAGALGEPNAIHTVLQAFALLKSSDLKVKLLLIGRGVVRKRLKEYAESESLDAVEFHDQIDKQDLMGVLRHASAGYISLRSEPIFRFGISPNKLWDYMLASLPVIFACKAANNPVDEHQCGLSADPACPQSIADAITTMYRLPEDVRENMGRSGREAVLQRYDYRELAAKLAIELESLKNK